MNECGCRAAPYLIVSPPLHIYLKKKKHTPARVDTSIIRFSRFSGQSRLNVCMQQFDICSHTRISLQYIFIAEDSVGSTFSSCWPSCQCSLFNMCQLSVITQVLHSFCRCHCFDAVVARPLALCSLPSKDTLRQQARCWFLFFPLLAFCRCCCCRRLWEKHAS